VLQSEDYLSRFNNQCKKNTKNKFENNMSTLGKIKKKKKKRKKKKKKK
jgi:hypothetical protein